MSGRCDNCHSPFGFGGGCWNSSCGVRMTPERFFRTHTPANAPPCIPFRRNENEEMASPAPESEPEYLCGDQGGASGRLLR